MQSDAATRILLASILLCLVILIVQGFTGAGLPADQIGRYSVTGLRAGGPILVRADSATGRAWKLDLRGGGAPDHWVEFRESAGERESPAELAPGAPLDQPDQERANPLGGDQPLQ